MALTKVTTGGIKDGTITNEDISATTSISQDKLAATPGASSIASGLMIPADKNKLDGVADNANNYSHPSAHTVSEVTGLQGLLDGKTTETYVNTQITNVIGAAPAALDTLTELAAALGDDANYAATVTTALAGKVDDSQVLTNVPSGALFTDTNTVYTHPTNHAISVVTGLQSALDAKVDDSQVLTDVPSGALFTDTNTTYSVGDGGLTQVNFTTADNTKLDGIEAGATADQTKADIEALGIAASSITGALPAISGANLTGIDAATVSATAPSSPTQGDMWFDTTGTTAMKVWSGSQWDQMSNKFSATGGTESTYSSGGTNYKVHTFTSSGTFTAEAVGFIDVLIVAGGGGGGSQVGGGGGAGGLIYNSSVAATQTSYSILVGGGGAGSATPGNQGGSGGGDGYNSAALSYTAIGGGGGGWFSGGSGRNGGSGGGCGGEGNSYGSGTSGQGNRGGNARSDDWTGGGGGGAGQPGQHGSSAPSGHGAYGGAGLNYSNEFGTSYSASGWFAGGGGGCNNAGRSGSGAGGTGGGGHGAGDGSNAGTGYPNTGGGGGGARDTGDGYGKPGGSGIVIIRYAI